MLAKIDITKHVLRPGIEGKPQRSRVLIQIKFQCALRKLNTQVPPQLGFLNGPHLLRFPDGLQENLACYQRPGALPLREHSFVCSCTNNLDMRGGNEHRWARVDFQ